MGRPGRGMITPAKVTTPWRTVMVMPGRVAERQLVQTYPTSPMMSPSSDARNTLSRAAAADDADQLLVRAGHRQVCHVARGHHPRRG